MRVAGLGFSRRATPDDFAQALVVAGPVAALATAQEKAAALRAALPSARVIGVAVRGVATPGQSPRAQAAHGTGSVAEAAALVAAGPGARLVLERQVIGGVVVAVAEGSGT